jgi:hypothetical protein
MFSEKLSTNIGPFKKKNKQKKIKQKRKVFTMRVSVK